MEPFQVAGLALVVVAAIVGGGLEAAGFKIRVVESLPRQLMLGGLGAALFVAGTPEVWSWTRPAPTPVAPVLSPAASTPTLALTVTALPSPAAAASTPTPSSAPSATPSPSPTSEPTATQTPTNVPVIKPAVPRTLIPGLLTPGRTDGPGGGRRP